MIDETVKQLGPLRYQTRLNQPMVRRYREPEFAGARHIAVELGSTAEPTGPEPASCRLRLRRWRTALVGASVISRSAWTAKCSAGRRAAASRGSSSNGWAATGRAN